MIDRFVIDVCSFRYVVGFSNIVPIKFAKPYKMLGNDFFNNGVKLDKASRGAGYSIRFKPNKSDKINLLAKGAKVLCSVEYFEELVKNSKYNKGEIIEKLVTEYYGQEWEKDNVPFTDDGDLTVNNIAYQIKFERATFINEKQIARMRAEDK